MQEPIFYTLTTLEYQLGFLLGRTAKMPPQTFTESPYYRTLGEGSHTNILNNNSQQEKEEDGKKNGLVGCIERIIQNGRNLVKNRINKQNKDQPMDVHAEPNTSWMEGLFEIFEDPLIQSKRTAVTDSSGEAATGFNLEESRKDINFKRYNDMVVEERGRMGYVDSVRVFFEEKGYDPGSKVMSGMINSLKSNPGWEGFRKGLRLEDPDIGSILGSIGEKWVINSDNFVSDTRMMQGYMLGLMAYTMKEYSLLIDTEEIPTTLSGYLALISGMEMYENPDSYTDKKDLGEKEKQNIERRKTNYILGIKIFLSKEGLSDVVDETIISNPGVAGGFRIGYFAEGIANQDCYEIVRNAFNAKGLLINGEFKDVINKKYPDPLSNDISKLSDNELILHEIGIRIAEEARKYKKMQQKTWRGFGLFS